MEIPISIALLILSLTKSLKNCFQVNAKYVGAKNVKGIRAAVYRAAVEHHAHYSIDRSKSIWYNEQSADLHISLLFKQEQEALSFKSYLEIWHLQNPVVVKLGDLCLKQMECITVEEAELSVVNLDDYVSAESESPLQSLQDFQSTRASLDSCLTAISASEPLAQFQSFEDEKLFSFQKPYKCHIKDKAMSSDALQKSTSNIITLSQTFHNNFDGMLTVDPITEQTRLPLVAIKPSSEEMREEYVGSPKMKRQRVEVEIEFRTKTVADFTHLKTGSSKISNTLWKSYIHVEDAKICRECMNWKYKRTKKAWEDADRTDEEMLNRD